MPASICGPGSCARAGAYSARSLAGGARGQSHLGPAKAGAAEAARRQGTVEAPGRIVIVGGGAARLCSGEMLRRQEFRGTIVLLSDDSAPPVDRPNLSKDYLAGSGAGGLAAAAPGQLLRRSRHRPSAQKQCRLDRYQRA